MNTPSGIANDVSALIEATPINRGHWRIFIIAIAIIIADGYCITSTGFAAPSLARDWAMEPGSLGPLFAATLVGLLIGAPIFGYIGDRFGRRPAILLATAIFASFTVFSAFAANVEQFIVIRVIDGIGIGGITSNIIALISEITPKRHRNGAVIGALTGTAIGGAIPGIVASLAPEAYIWQSIFIIGGVVGLVLLAFAWLYLPESPVFLESQKKYDQARAVLSRLIADPSHLSTMPANDGSTEPKSNSASPAELFRGPLAFASPLLWLLNVCNFMVIYFLLSWTPILLEQINISADRAALVNSVFSISAMAGGLLAIRFVDRFNFLAVAAMFGIGAIMTAAMGSLGTTGYPVLLAIAFFAGAAIPGNQFVLGAMSAFIYPPKIRSAGAGWALFAGRLAAVAGPLIGGALIQAQFSIAELYLSVAIPLLVAAIASTILWQLWRRTLPN